MSKEKGSWTPDEAARILEDAFLSGKQLPDSLLSKLLSIAARRDTSKKLPLVFSQGESGQGSVPDPEVRSSPNGPGSIWMLPNEADFASSKPVKPVPPSGLYFDEPYEIVYRKTRDWLEEQNALSSYYPF